MLYFWILKWMHLADVSERQNLNDLYDLWLSFTFWEDIRVLLVHWQPLCVAPYVWLTASQDGCFSVFIYLFYLFFRRQCITFGNRCPVRPVHSAHDRFLTCGSVWNRWFWLALCGRALQSCRLWEMLFIFSWLFTEESQQACTSKVMPCPYNSLYFALRYLWVSQSCNSDNPCAFYATRHILFLLAATWVEIILLQLSNLCFFFSGR